MKYKSAESDPEAQTGLRRQLRNSATPAEATLWRRLKNSGADGYKFRRQHGIGPYVLDFYCPLLRLAIELDGSVHEQYGQAVHDAMRDAFLNEQGITVMRFRNEVVWTNIEAIVEAVKEFAEKKRL